jgi:ADP-ribosyl-[dinitrogen reductase] hydrolase
VDALLAEGRNVIVHCHGGRSRTGLVLKAWAMRTYGYSEREAHSWLGDQWHRYADYNDAFVEFLDSDWPSPARP